MNINNKPRSIAVTLFVIAMVLAGTFVPTISQAQGYISITPIIGPATPTPQFVMDTIYAKRNNLESYGMFQAIPCGSSVSITNVLNVNGVGQSLRYSMTITDSVPFTLSGILYTLNDKFSSYSGKLGDYGISYSNFGEGVGVDGTIYNSGNAETPVVAIYAIGWGSGFDVSTPSFTDALKTWGPLLPDVETIQLQNGTTKASSSITYVEVVPVPETSTNILMITGGIMVLLYRYFRRTTLNT